MSMGVLTVDVWPPYLGMATDHPGERGSVAPAGEPFGDINYTRGLIQWRNEPDAASPSGVQVVGSAHIYLPAGIFWHLVFFYGPHAVHQVAGSNQLEQPVVFDRPGMIEINPIRNQVYLPR